MPTSRGSKQTNKYNPIGLLFALQLVTLGSLAVNSYLLRENTKVVHDVLVIHQKEDEQWDHFMGLMNSWSKDPNTADHNNTADRNIKPPPATLDNPYIQRTW